MIDIESVTWRNFLSYGDYDTTIEFSKLGQCLITGEIINESPKESYDASGDVTPIRKSNGAGKCLDGDTMILLNDGQRIKIRDANSYIGYRLPAIGKNLKQTTATIIGYCQSGLRPCFEINTQSGRSLICSGDHKILSFENNWSDLNNIKVGDHIAINRSVKLIATKSAPLYELELLGLLLGDGCFRSSPTICISDDEPQIKTRIEHLLSCYGDIILSSSNDHRRKSKGKNYRIIDKYAKYYNKHRINTITNMIRKYGLFGCVRERKFLPEEILCMPPNAWIAIIVGFWQADGWLCIGRPKHKRKGRISIGCCNKSSRLIYTIQHLLTRLGIYSKVRHKNALCTTTKKRFSSWILEIYQSSTMLFIKLFGDRLKEAGCQVDEAINISTQISTQLFVSRNVDLIPSKVFDIIYELCGDKWKKYAPDQLRKSRSMYVGKTKSTSHDVVAYFGKSLDNDYLKQLSASDIIWDKVKSISYVGNRNTYDIEVRMEDPNDDPNFFANDIITHNSACVNALQWSLFGRTMHCARPGNKVLNWYTGKNCVATTRFKNGDYISRIRTTDGTTELLYGHKGDEYKYVGDTLSTSENQQKQLLKKFGLDYNIFCGSAFFNQYNESWMEMSDQSRKKIMERILHVDRFAYYTKVAKGKTEVLDRDITKKNDKIISLYNDIARFEEQIIRLQYSFENFNQSRLQRQQEAIDSAIEEERLRDSIILPDIEKLKKRWDIIKQVESKISEMQTQSNKLYQELSRARSDLSAIDSKIADWSKKHGKICVACEQAIQADHIDNKIEPYLKKKEEYQRIISKLETDYNSLKEATRKATESLQKNKPDLTLSDADGFVRRKRRHGEDAVKYRENAKAIELEANPHNSSIEEYRDKIVEYNKKIYTLQEEIKLDTMLNIHYQYTYKAYNDRAKIKSFVFEKHIPYINSRIKHYLDAFGLDITIELTSSLGIISNLWGYEFESGGERKRTDVAMMLAMFDFHEQMYGRQCNVLILDEVDGRLDDDGIDSLINIIKCDLAPRVEAILIISHRNQMADVYPKEIKVRRDNRFSQLEMI